MNTPLPLAYASTAPLPGTILRTGTRSGTYSRPGRTRDLRDIHSSPVRCSRSSGQRCCILCRLHMASRRPTRDFLEGRRFRLTIYLACKWFTGIAIYSVSIRIEIYQCNLSGGQTMIYRVAKIKGGEILVNILAVLII